jgi:hypothetical protein
MTEEATARLAKLETSIGAMHRAMAEMRIAIDALEQR